MTLHVLGMDCRRKLVGSSLSKRQACSRFLKYSISVLQNSPSPIGPRSIHPQTVQQVEPGVFRILPPGATLATTAPDSKPNLSPR